MKKIFCLLLLLAYLLSVGCEPARNKIDTGLETLKVLEINEESSEIVYIPVRAVLTGPGKKGLLMVEMGDKKLVQGLIMLQEDPEEVQKLQTTAQARLGKPVRLKKSLTADIKIKLEFAGKTLLEHSVIGSFISLPVQFTIENAEPCRLDVTLQFTSGKQQKKVQTRTYAYSGSKTLTASGSDKEVKVKAIATSTFSASDNGIPENFVIKHKIDF